MMKKALKRALRRLVKSPLFVLALPVVAVIRLLRPLLLVRIGALYSPRMGHFAANTELYLCERDAGINLPRQRHVDLFYMSKPICNNELATMWKRVLHVWPNWFLAPASRVNRLFSGWECHDVGDNTQLDRDVHNLLDKFPAHLKFTPTEEARGMAGLRAMGIAPNDAFVCLNVRDSAYLQAHQPSFDYSYHDYRDCDIQNFVLAAEELAARGFHVVRMGAAVGKPIPSAHPRVIDYAANGMRSEFMDIYLGAKCAFCISVGSGFDAVPLIFRRPIVFANHVPVGYLNTFSSRFIGITKHHYGKAQERCLTLAEIVSHGVGFSLRAVDYRAQGIELIENTPEEIRDVVVEMAERLDGTWCAGEDEGELQERFRQIFPSDARRNEAPLHGEIRSRYGAAFLTNNRWWLDPLSSNDVQHRPAGAQRQTINN